MVFCNTNACTTKLPCIFLCFCTFQIENSYFLIAKTGDGSGSLTTEEEIKEMSEIADSVLVGFNKIKKILS